MEGGRWWQVLIELRSWSGIDQIVGHKGLLFFKSSILSEKSFMMICALGTLSWEKGYQINKAVMSSSALGSLNTDRTL